MSSNDDLQKQSSKTLGIAQANGYTIGNIAGTKMQGHVQDPSSLKSAPVYVEEVEDRERQLQAENTTLLTALRAKTAELDDRSEFNALKVDLQQAHWRIEYYKELANNAQIRAERYQNKLAEAQKRQTAADQKSRTIERMECEISERESTILKLLQENQTINDLNETRHEQDLRLIEKKNTQIADLISYSNRIEAERLEALDLSEKVSKSYDSLIQSLEAESTTISKVLNENSVSLINHVKSADQLYSIIVTEFAPLVSFFDHSDAILAVYQSVFRKLSDPNGGSLANMPRTLENLLGTANEELKKFQDLSTALQGESLPQEKIRHQVSELAKIARRMYISLDDIKGDVARFLVRLHNNSDQRLAMRKNCPSEEKGDSTRS